MARVDEEPVAQDATFSSLVEPLGHLWALTDNPSELAKCVRSIFGDTLVAVVASRLSTPAVKQPSSEMRREIMAFASFFAPLKRFLTEKPLVSVGTRFNEWKTSLGRASFEGDVSKGKKSFANMMSVSAGEDDVWLDESALLKLQLWVLAESNGEARRQKVQQCLPGALLTTASWSASAEDAMLMERGLGSLMHFRSAEIAGAMSSFVLQLEERGCSRLELSTGAEIEAIRFRRVVLLSFSGGRESNVKAMLSERWGARLTRACQGSCGVHQIAPSIASSRFSFEDSEQGPHPDREEIYSLERSFCHS